VKAFEKPEEELLSRRALGVQKTKTYVHMLCCHSNVGLMELFVLALENLNDKGATMDIRTYKVPIYPLDDDQA
jgi:hypothetical protein